MTGGNKQTPYIHVNMSKTLDALAAATLHRAHLAIYRAGWEMITYGRPHDGT